MASLRRCPWWYLLRDERSFRFLIEPSSVISNSQFFPLFPMTDSSNTPTTRAMVRSVRASLRLVSCSSELLTESQLFAVKKDLQETLAIVNGQIQAIKSGTSLEDSSGCFATDSCFIDDHKLVIDMSDWEDTSDEDEKDDRSASVGEYPTCPTSRWLSHKDDSCRPREGRTPCVGNLVPIYWYRY